MIRILLVENQSVGRDDNITRGDSGSVTSLGVSLYLCYFLNSK